jgi:trk system potassium uptake protein TrkH
LFSTSFESYKNDLFINSIIAFASIAGAIGFFVIYNLTRYIKSKLFLKKRRKNKRKIFLSLHTKMVLILSFTLVFSGIFIIFFAENRTSTLPKTSQIVYAAFQTISASTTTGFNSVNIGSMSDTSLFFIIILMFIGASPGGTGGGIKSTTFGIMLLAMIAFLKGRKDTNIFWRRIPPETTTKAFGLAIIAVIVVLIDGLILSYTEKESFIKIVFEIVSALATTGLSAGITPDLSTPGKLVICITMIIGRLGPLTIGFLLVGKTRPINLKYPAEEVFIG